MHFADGFPSLLSRGATALPSNPRSAKAATAQSARESLASRIASAITSTVTAAVETGAEVKSGVVKGVKRGRKRLATYRKVPKVDSSVKMSPHTCVN